MTDASMPLIELLQKQDDGDFLRAVAETVLQLLMEHDVEGVIGAGRYERGDGRLTLRNGYRDRELPFRRLQLPPRDHSGLATPSAKMRLQSSFMLMTVQPRCLASSISAWEKVPTCESGRPLAGP